MSHIGATQLLNLVIVRHNGYTITGKAGFAHVRTPGNRIAGIDSIVEHFHQFVDRQVVRQSMTPVILDFDRELGIERTMCIRCQRHIVGRIQTG